jgi:hypothetical protein
MKPRNYQIQISDQAYNLLTDYKIAYLALEVRTGKTITALLTAKKYGVKKILFVTKKKAIKGIEEDFKHFDFEHVIINYESVEKADIEPDLVIIDESHSLGAFPKPSQRTLKLKEICRNKLIIYLSGTPSHESYSQLFHQFFISSFSPFLEYKNFYKWANDFVNKKKRYVYNREINDYSDGIKELIMNRCGHLFINYTQKEAGFEKVINEKILHVEMHPQTYNLASRLRKDLIYESGDKIILADTAVKLQSKLHQIFSGSVKSESGDIITFDYSKAVFIKENFKGKKIAIFYKFIGERNILKATFSNWTESPQDFQENNNLVFIGQFQSAREGIRLDTADCIIFYNIDFSFLSYEQARNRIMSKERIKEAVLYWVFSVGGIENYIYKAVSKKKDFTTSYFRNEYLKHAII